MRLVAAEVPDVVLRADKLAELPDVVLRVVAVEFLAVPEALLLRAEYVPVVVFLGLPEETDDAEPYERLSAALLGIYATSRIV